MKISNKVLSLCVEAGKLKVINNRKMEALSLDWPSVSVSINGKEISPSGQPLKSVMAKNSMCQVFEEDGIRFTVQLSIGAGPWFTKNVLISSENELPTPDYVEVDRQSLPDDNLCSCGYKATKFLNVGKGEEEGTGIMPGCGYPLIGKNFFIGMEHSAAFSETLKKGGRELISLRHYPVWENKELQVVNEVFGWADGPGKVFGDYLETIRIPALKKPFVSFCTFWSDPYLGNYEYDVSYEAYEAFFKAFEKHGLIPDAFTLDAGWNDRQSVFQSKKKVGGDKGLVKLRQLAEKMGSALSLWSSHNGPMGVSPEFMKKMGFEIGSGKSAAYCGDGYGVMMDEHFAEALEKRYCELASKVGAVHFKIDWDNDCATNASFNKIYPSVNHVRQASLNAFFKIARKLRKTKKNIITRNGWWVSPWWLSEASHVWLPDSGDSEYTSLPSKTQRDAASTHRDLMYYNVLRRDKSAIYLDCFDNHEFPDAFRNPFMEDPLSWTNAVWLSFMRGSTYIAYTLQPESLESRQVESLKQIMKFCRTYSEKIFTSRGQMVLGHPGHGEVYGFYQPGKNESWCLLRNPLPIPQKIKFSPESFSSHKVKTASQFYPHYETLETGKELLFLAHEIKIVVFSSEKSKASFSMPYMAVKKGKDYLYSFPASENVSKQIKPMSAEIQQIKKMECGDFTKENIKNGIRYKWFVTVPYRMREMELQFSVKTVKGMPEISAYSSRYNGFGSLSSLPVTELKPGMAGHGEGKNPDSSCAKDIVYYSVKVPAGGQFGLFLQMGDFCEGTEILSAWLAGYQAPSRNSLLQKKAPMGFGKCLPYQHPLGFGKAFELPLS